MSYIARKDIAHEAAMALEKNSEFQVSVLPPAYSKKTGPKEDGRFLINDKIELPLEVRLNLRKKQIKALQERMAGIPNCVS